MTRKIRPLWSKEPCCDCGQEGYATRTQSRPVDEPYYCAECAVHRSYEGMLEEYSRELNQVKLTCKDVVDECAAILIRARSMGEDESHKTELAKSVLGKLMPFIYPDE